MHLKTYAYGFCLLPHRTPVDLLPSYSSAELPAAFTLHDDTRRPLDTAQTADGGEVLVHGRVYDLAGDDAAGEDPPGVTAAQRLAVALGHGERTFLEQLDLLAGRFVVLRLEQGRLWIYNDAIGTRSVYHREGGGAAASHAHLLADALDLGPSGVLKASHTWDRSPFDGVTALPPNHRMEVHSGHVERDRPSRPNAWTGSSADERLNRVRQLWAREMELAVRQGIPFRFALSGGADSRCALALSHPWTDRIPSFTYDASKTVKADSARVLDLDEQLVQPLVHLSELQHKVLEHEDPQLRHLTDDELAARQRNSVGAHVRWLLAHYLTHNPDNDQLVLRANAFEIAQHKWASPQDDVVVQAAKQRLVTRASRSGVEMAGETLAEYFDRAFDVFGLEGDLCGYLACDLTHWEYRMGRWAREIYNEIDLAFDSFVAISRWAMLEPLLAFTRTERASSIAFRELFNRTVPVLSFFGMNNPANLSEVSRGATVSSTPGGTTTTVPTQEPLIPVTSDGMASVRSPRHDDDAFLHVPAEHFRTSNAVHRLVHQCASDGELYLDCHSSWSSPAGDRSLSDRALVDDRVVPNVPGAHAAGRLPIAIRGLRVGQAVRLAALVHKDRDRPSWDKASRASVSHIRFDAVPHDLPVPTAEATGLDPVEGSPTLSLNPEATTGHALSSVHSTVGLD